MSAISFETIVYDINTWRIVLFPKAASDKLPSRGMVMIKGTMNGVSFETTLEPDGSGSHWFRVNDVLSKEAAANIGDTVKLVVEPMTAWHEPELPLDLERALDKHDLMTPWRNLTTRARWEWIRWIRFTHNPLTREKRIATACSMLKSGKKRPCCFDLSRCTEPAVSKSGVLLEPEKR